MPENSHDFLAMVHKSMGSDPQKKTVGKSQTPVLLNNPQKKAQAYLETLRINLMSRGKSLDQLVLNKDDLYVLKDLLSQCGYGKKAADQCITNLLQNQTAGKIALSDFFDHVDKLGSPQKKSCDPTVVNASAIPHLESALRDFGLSPKQAETILNRARTADGGLDLEKFIGNLKQFVRRQNGNVKITTNRNRGYPNVPVIDDTATTSGSESKSGFDSLADFISALEKATGRSAGKIQGMAKAQADTLNRPNLDTANLSKLVSEKPESLLGDNANIPNVQIAGSESRVVMPAEVQRTIRQILAKTVSDDNQTSLASVATVSKFKHAEQTARKITAKNGEESADGRKSAAFVAASRDGMPENAGRQEIRRSSLPQPVSPDFKLDSEKTPPDLQHMTELKPGTEIKSVAMPVETGTYQGPEVTTDAATKQQAASPVPNYLIGQLGRQISRSIQKGDGIVRLQLKPPELGAVKLEMDLNDNLLKLGVITENRAVKGLLLNHMHELRENLQEQGVKLEKLDVQIQQDINQSLADFKENLSERSWSNENGKDRSTVLPDDCDISDEITDDGNLSDGEYLLDVRV